QFGGSEDNQKTIIGHPVGLFILFFTEMWERFSYYGMRAILVFYLVSDISKHGFGWDQSSALMLYGTYTSLVYLTPLVGGWLADRVMGFRNAVTAGALLMTLGHVSLAFESVPTFYLGLTLLILGNGLFKPNISSIVGNMYPPENRKKDSAFTIFYMGVNAGAFLGMLICGWLGETYGWNYGFGCAGIFMFFGMLQFYFGQNIFGEIGLRPTKLKRPDRPSSPERTEEKVPFTKRDVTLLGVSLTVLVATIIAWFKVPYASIAIQYASVLPFICIMLFFVLNRLKRYPKVEKDRLGVIALLAFFTVFFWLAFEQAGGTMGLFAKDFTNRSLVSEGEIRAFQIISIALTVIPMLILTWVLGSLAVRIAKQYPLTIVFTGLSFAIIWGVIYMINEKNFDDKTLEIPASWFGTLNSFFIISLAPLFSNAWAYLSKRNRNISGPIKFAMGLFLLGAGFLALSFGASSIPQGATSASVSIIWLVMAYFLHTVGELFLSPVGLSYVNKLSPKRLLAFMFGVWYLSNFVANFLAGLIGSYMEEISKKSSISNFFFIFVISSAVAGIALLLLNKKMKKMMHGIDE
ncbi:MAG: peptide MFS transporter, partial [Flavobacteriales bacterium]|nr:peptide MFS transporter [Flavobacteriales bacterium]